MTVSTMTGSTLPTLKNGDSGDAVRFLEQLLSSIYWFGLQQGRPSLITNLVIFDAQYDSQCQQVVTEFQKNYNAIFPFPSPDITVDGVVGPQTWKALADAIFKYTY
ncbi:MAG: peptidoglycan-binding protein [Okeania sp. SIO3H1]|uniref:peptidoglycan-binding domain-containing protein n=1 Tax=Okeania sp. SIO1I7 TaxID=2607772 RepID=UPI0013C64C33|nr:peptidoglycan-binding domain-containing protein [Okeania sp. SIO1I7]NEN90890.1 peptidoglycan-binding protein [Okeania sp. SIO3H1]NET23988.1 peptidoglycan-binding protein [Okeania sp. SIO1I7]